LWIFNKLFKKKNECRHWYQPIAYFDRDGLRYYVIECIKCGKIYGND